MHDGELLEYTHIYFEWKGATFSRKKKKEKLKVRNTSSWVAISINSVIVVTQIEWSLAEIQNYEKTKLMSWAKGFEYFEV